MNSLKRHYIWLSALGVILSLGLLCCYLFLSQGRSRFVAQQPQKKTKIITVFIHGSLFPDTTFIETMSLSDLNTVLFDTVEHDSEYVNSLKRVRANPDLYRDQIMLEEGFCEIEHPSVAQLCDIVDNSVEPVADSRSHEKICRLYQDTVEKHKNIKVAHHAIACYNSFIRRLFPDCDTAYYTFGHLGVLSHRYRERMAFMLYDELLEKVQEARAEYDDVKVVLVAHSHGGGIALNLARVEDEHKEGLTIDTVVLFGTPLQYETAGYAYHHMFKQVLNCYSLGDKIQGSDILTTSARACYKTFLSIAPLAYSHGRVHDIQLVVNDDTHAITHSSMWHMQRLRVGSCYMEPFPYAVITPLLLHAFKEQEFGPRARATIRSVHNQLTIELCDMDLKHHRYVSLNIYDLVARMRNQILAHVTQGYE